MVHRIPEQQPALAEPRSTSAACTTDPPRAAPPTRDVSDHNIASPRAPALAITKGASTHSRSPGLQCPTHQALNGNLAPEDNNPGARTGRMAGANGKNKARCSSPVYISAATTHRAAELDSHLGPQGLAAAPDTGSCSADQLTSLVPEQPATCRLPHATAATRCSPRIPRPGRMFAPVLRRRDADRASDQPASHGVCWVG